MKQNFYVACMYNVPGLVCEPEYFRLLNTASFIKK